MAKTRTSAALAFEGFYGDLARLGLPLPLVVSLETKDLTLESAMWNARCSAGGFSVTLFWPESGNVKTKRKRTRRRKKPTQIKIGQDGKAEESSEKRKNDAGSIVEDPVPAEVANTPINVPPVLGVSDGSGTGPVDDGSQVIDLVNCEGVEFEMREGKPGVKFRQGSEEEWTPVVRKRNQKRKNHSDESCETSDADLKITRHSI